MVSLKRKQEGFTIVELLIVIIVIGILATLVITTFTGVQQKARDTKRQTDINAINSQINAYNAQSGNFPTLANMNTPAWVSTNLKGLEANALCDPKGACPGTLADNPAANVYAYHVRASDGTTACDNSATPCATYTLTATLEGGGTFVKTGNN
jgi:general secretion pathway protein G